MALFRKFFYRKPPDGLLEISERVYVFDCCFTTDVLGEDEYKVYIGGIVSQLREHSPEASFMVFNFREGEHQSQIADILSEYDMTVMDYPRQYEGCPLLTMEMVHHFLRSSESWLSLGQQNVLLMHCERGGWPVLAFMLAGLLIYRKQYMGEQKTLDMIYKQAPRELLQLLSPLNPLPSQLRYLQYISRRNVGSQWPPLARALTLDCVILRMLPNFDGEGGCRPVFRIYGQDPLVASDRTPKVLFSTPKKSKTVRLYRQADCELVKIDIHCHIQGDAVLECISLDGDLEREEMMFRVMFNTAFIRSNILMLNRDDIDILWDAKERFPKDFRAEVLLSEMDAPASLDTMELANAEEKEGLPVEAFAKVQEIFSTIDWADVKGDAALHVLQQLTSSNVLQEQLDAVSPQKLEIELQPDESSPDMLKERVKLDKFVERIVALPSPSLLKQESVPFHMQSPDSDTKNQNIKHHDLQTALLRPSSPKILSQRLPKSRSNPASSVNSLQSSPVPVSRYHSAPSALGITALLQDHASFVRPEVAHSVTMSPSAPSLSSFSEPVVPKIASTSLSLSDPKIALPPSPPPPPTLIPFSPTSIKKALATSPSLPSPFRPPTIPDVTTAMPIMLQPPKAPTQLALLQPPLPRPLPPPLVPFETVKSSASAPPPHPHPPSPPSEPQLLIASQSSSLQMSSHSPPTHEHSDPKLVKQSPSLSPPHSSQRLSSASIPPKSDMSAYVPPAPVMPSRGPPVPPPPPPPPPSPSLPSFGKPSPSPPPPVSSSTPPTSPVVSSSTPPPPPPPPVSSSTPPPPPPPPLVSSSTPPPPLPTLISSSTPPPPPLPVKRSSAPPPPPLPSCSGLISSAPTPPPPPQLSSKNTGGTTPRNSPSIPPPPLVPLKGSPAASSQPPPPPNGMNGPSNALLGAKGRGRTSSRPSAQSSSKKAPLKPLHWVKVTRAMQGSLWAETQKPDEASKAPEFDMSELESLFSAAVQTSDLRGSADRSGGRLSLGQKSEKVHLIDLRRANNCEIMLTKVKMPLADLMSSVLALDDTALDGDQVDNLIKFCPTKEEMDLLKGFSGDKESLGKCEQYFLELMKVPRVESKLRVFSFKIQFRSQVADLRDNLNIVNSAAGEIRSSVKLKRIMQTILSLGNALNQGTARGSAVGFRLDSLLKLTDTRARNNKMTLMHYLCKVLSEKLPQLLDFPKDLISLEAASKIQLKTLAEEMQAISKGLEKVEQELTASENDGHISETFRKTLKEFLVGAEAEVRTLTLLYSNVGRNADALALYFGEDPARCPFEQVISTLLNFVRMFVRALEENCKQIELEKKKAQKEADNEKMKLGGQKREHESLLRSPTSKSPRSR